MSLILILILILSTQGCSQQKDSSDLQRKSIDTVFSEYQDSLLSLPGVQGFYQGEGENGSVIIVIMVDTLREENKNQYPAELEGYPVKIEETGVIKPLNNSSPGE